MSITKPLFRDKCLKKIKNCAQHNKFYRDAMLNLALSKELKKYKHKKILFYYPLPFEANITKTLLKMRKSSEIYLPFMQGESFKMVPFRLPLKQSKFGIFEAGNTFKNIKKIDIAIVPAVGIDRNLQRIGFGKGMYDRFFAKLQKRPYTIFIQTEFCYTNESICDVYDIRCDLLLTPKVRILPKARINS
ncbi:MAG: 5-formyltetrahydrofolate cyclo-ligase [Epsilonproteobacteria bacterium]|nr:5-formyltetrahydrofolate cyclo-ligase [Campylobacterota bacterium]OIO17093.1 MAG: 5-formyltetrahydrofolate cyclo-ligase [Helicobacteraceae bacterium CG1_02_36_14]PIP10808.1 MAG: 5-formyltetrahydrofolate cyclo-ligase [Sulfurimonas sp. CG23_combo_of_CG06-09_8_20_14_all_36_33]PIS24269.1 MAG: 5-formyltetrahydrofolate cyclo-ligase [Sulfurimonas sp. CG08_land_8_20_14_0_20_36_33]PIU36074.1 MAG: 5-formyltetrahydrofolate cyclo-ligase [Sulfurimonas sp. CG07_land_8_20_14_0_80_36_56]PIV04419.1 MAG: 5-f